ncbi:peroxiredoxin [Candidatus Peregrinibacteria bacterium]|jgi:thioredoxin-dependent peroxiredoxin|nr:peroxiredoxin [Candidatus Peregrinibacteria bacterium]MBT4632287.1 peroxiredoxin [Candidatus Peregrinibacteria bacterium]MBT5824302.1 peroxiredoxin [Candidatus Peregrinibacteria bacterium]
MLNTGDQIPDLGLKSTEGKYLILFFYPKDNTPGCTLEACSFRDHQSDFSDLNAVIVGVSKDSEKSHEKFVDKFNLPYELIADEDLKLVNAFGVLKEKNMFGKKYMGIERSTFLIDPNGKILQSWRKVKVLGHTKEILEELRNL